MNDEALLNQFLGTPIVGVLIDVNIYSALPISSGFIKRNKYGIARNGM